MRRSRKYLKTGVEVWAGHNAWFWRLINARHDRGMIGVTASEAEAVREAHVAIREVCETPPIENDRECRPDCLEPRYFYEY